MSFEKGNKLGTGRPKGAENKDKKELRIAITKLLDNNHNKFNKEFNKLEGKDFIDRYISLLEYSTPKLNRTDLTNDGDKFDFSSIDGNTALDRLNKLLAGRST